MPAYPTEDMMQDSRTSAGSDVVRIDQHLTNVSDIEIPRDIKGVNDDAFARAGRFIADSSYVHVIYIPARRMVAFIC